MRTTGAPLFVRLRSCVQRMLTLADAGLRRSRLLYLAAVQLVVLVLVVSPDGAPLPVGEALSSVAVGHPEGNAALLSAVAACHGSHQVGGWSARCDHTGVPAT